MSINELNAKVNDLRELYRMADELEAEIDSIQDEIKAHMTAADVDTISGTDYKITWKWHERAYVKTADLKKEAPDIAAKYTAIRKTRAFCLT